MTVTHLGTIKLDASAPPVPPIRGVLDFDIDDRGCIGFLRCDRNQLDLVLLDQSGTSRSAIGLVEGALSRGLPKLRWLGSDRWAVFAAEWKEDGKLRARGIDATSGSVEAMDGLDCPPSDAIAGDGRGGFVVYVTVSSAGSKWPVLRDMFRTFEGAKLLAFDSAGAQRWCAWHEAGSIPRVPMGADIAVTSEGRIVLLDDNDGNLVVFTSEGRYLTTMEAGELWYCMGRHSQVSRDVRGGIVVNDPYGTPTIWRVPVKDRTEPELTGSSVDHPVWVWGGDKSKGYVRSELRPRYASGHSFGPLRGVRAAPDGHLWACDGESFLRLDDNGAVDLVWGEAANDEILRDIDECFIDLQGRTYLLNGRTGAVHVLDYTGKRLHICRPAPQDFESGAFCDMAVAGDGSVYTWEGYTRYLRFSPDGKRLGFDQLGLTWVNGRVIFQPRNREFWITHDREFHLASADGKRLCTIRQRPDGRTLTWLCGEVVAPDGSIAVIDDAQLFLPESPGDRSRCTINTYSKNGDPIRTLRVPEGIEPGWSAFDGKCIVVCSERDQSLILLDGETGDPRRLVSGTDSHRLTGRPFFSMGGRDLWSLHIETRLIERYKMP